MPLVVGSSCLLIAVEITSAIFYSFNGLHWWIEVFDHGWITNIVHVWVCIKHYCIIQIRLLEWNDTKDYIVARLTACSTCFIDAEIVDECIKYLCVEIDVQKSNLHKSNDTNIRISCSVCFLSLWSLNPFISSVNRYTTLHGDSLKWRKVHFKAVKLMPFLQHYPRLYALHARYVRFGSNASSSFWSVLPFKQNLRFGRYNSHTQKSISPFFSMAQ